MGRNIKCISTHTERLNTVSGDDERTEAVVVSIVATVATEATVAVKVVVVVLLKGYARWAANLSVSIYLGSNVSP